MKNIYIYIDRHTDIYENKYKYKGTYYILYYRKHYPLFLCKPHDNFKGCIKFHHISFIFIESLVTGYFTIKFTCN